MFTLWFHPHVDNTNYNGYLDILRHFPSKKTPCQLWFVSFWFWLDCNDSDYPSKDLANDLFSVQPLKS